MDRLVHPTAEFATESSDKRFQDPASSFSLSEIDESKSEIVLCENEPSPTAKPRKYASSESGLIETIFTRLPCIVLFLASSLFQAKSRQAGNAFESNFVLEESEAPCPECNESVTSVYPSSDLSLCHMIQDRQQQLPEFTLPKDRYYFRESRARSH